MPFLALMCQLNVTSMPFSLQIACVDGQVMVPGIDLADHHPNPSCSVINDLESNAFLLTANRKIFKGESLTIDYGPLSSDELLSDYGFTVESNPHDRVSVNCDFTVLGIVRLAMGQVGSDGAGGPLLPPAPISTAADIEESTSSSSSTIGRGGPELNDRWLHQWQIYWLSALNLYGPKADYGTLGHTLPYCYWNVKHCYFLIMLLLTVLPSFQLPVV